MSNENPPRVIAGRYTLVERLGAGMMGEVHRAQDAELGRDVALKFLRDAQDVVALKREFRSLADLRHPNLVALYELVVDREIPFLTMELVSGVDLVTWVRTSTDPVDRLRAVVPQLLDGLGVLHESGRFHRDIKPSNVLVTPEGRAVLVDFGLAYTRPIVVSRTGEPRNLAGTPEYMAPEQLWGAPPTSASDVYALGVTMREALAEATKVPADLADVVRDLLEPDPLRRPGIGEIRRRLGTERASSPRLPSRASLWEAPFIDREEPIAMLRQALDDVRNGAAVAIRIEGPSGIGKSALVRNFLSSLEPTDRAAVLAGRCYPQESVPFKAIDPLVDSLSELLERLSEPEIDAIAAGRVASLLRLFPALGRCARLREIASRGVVPAEPDEIRRAGFAELLELLRRLSTRFTMVLWIDDLQWGDPDSAIFLRLLVAERDAPPLLLLLTHRSAEWEMGGARTIRLDPLSASQARSLAREVVLRGAAPSAPLDEIVREAGGNPFLVCELARHCAVAGDESGGVLPAGIAEIVAERIRTIDEAARRLLFTVAVAGGPCSRSAAARAAGLGRGVADALTILRNQCLLQDSGGGSAELETYHDRIREGVLEGIASDERRSIHLSLAAALELEAEVDPFRLVEHYHGGGDVVRAARTAAEAARRAHAALAFEQAARLYELAIRVGGDDAERGRWQRGRADALAQAGRGGEAGEAYAEAADASASRGAPPGEVNELVRLAAEQYLRSGYLVEGRAALRRALAAVGESYPVTALGALASLVRRRASLAVRGVRYRRREASEIDPGRLRRIDTCWAAAEGLIWSDGLRSADFQARYARLALDAGEPTRVVRALCTEAAFQALFGNSWGSRRARRALDAARALAEELRSPLAEGLTLVCEAAAAYLSGHFPEGRLHSVRAEEILRTRCTGVAWELTNAHIFGSWSLAHMGDFRALDESVPGLLARARERGDLLAYCTLLGGIPNVMRLLAADSVAEATAAVEEAVRRWPTADFQLPNYFALVSASLIDLYAGRPGSAHRRLEDAWQTIRGAGLLAFRLVRTEARQLRARCAVASLAEDPARAPGAIVRAARRSARRIGREDMPWARPLAAAIVASACAYEGDAAETSRALGHAAEGFDAAAMRAWAAAARHQDGDPAGTAALVAAGVRNPARFAEALIPIHRLRRGD